MKFSKLGKMIRFGHRWGPILVTVDMKNKSSQENLQVMGHVFDKEILSS